MLKVWIARDKDGKLFLHRYKPTYDFKGRFFDGEQHQWYVHPSDPLGEGITFENSPKELSLVEIGEVKALRKEVENLKSEVGHYKALYEGSKGKAMNDQELNKWHIAINVYHKQVELGNFKKWMYKAKNVASSIPYMTHYFMMERTENLPKTHQQCSRSKPQEVINNHLTCALGIKCKNCEHLIALEKADILPEIIDKAKAWTCCMHIVWEKAQNKNFDDSEGFIVTVDDRMLWNTVHNSLAQS